MPTAGGVRAGQAYVEAYLEDSKLQRQLGAAQAKLRTWGKSLTSIGGTLAGIGAGIGAPIVAATKAYVDAASAMVDLSAKTGVTVESLSALKFAAEQSGSSIDAIETGFKGMSRFLDTAAQGGKAATETLGRLGLSVKDLLQMKPDERFAAFAEAISHIDDDGERSALAMKVFGKSAMDLMPLLKGGEAGLAEFRKRAQELGIVMDGESAQAAEAFGDSLDALKASFGAVLMQVGPALIPQLQELANWLLQIAPAVGQWVRDNQELVGWIAKLSAGLIVIGGGMAAFGTAMSIGSKAIDGFNTVSKLATVNGGLFTKVFVGFTLAALVVELMKATDAMKDFADEMERAAKLQAEVEAKRDAREQAVVDQANAIKDPEERKKFIEDQIAQAEKEIAGAQANVRASKKAAEQARDNWFKKGVDTVGMNADADMARQQLQDAEAKVKSIQDQIDALKRLQVRDSVGSSDVDMSGATSGTAPVPGGDSDGPPATAATPSGSPEERQVAHLASIDQNIARILQRGGLTFEA